MLGVFVVAALIAADPQPEYVEERVTEMFEMAVGRYPHLVLDDELSRDSQKWAAHLARTGRFHHDRNVCENIARGYKTSKEAMRGWFRSSGHERQFRRNTRVGFGVFRSARGRWLWVCRFKPL